MHSQNEIDRRMEPSINYLFLPDGIIEHIVKNKLWHEHKAKTTEEEKEKPQID